MTATAHSRMLDTGLLIIRLALAAVFMYHGAQKLFGAFGGPGISGFAGFLTNLGVPLPTLSAVLAGSAEFFGGLVLLIGTGTRIAAIPMAFTMLIAVTMVHNKAFSAAAGGMEYALTLGLILVALIFTGPGRFTLGRLIALATEKSLSSSSHPRPATA